MALIILAFIAGVFAVIWGCYMFFGSKNDAGLLNIACGIFCLVMSVIEYGDYSSKQTLIRQMNNEITVEVKSVTPDGKILDIDIKNSTKK